VVNDEQRRLIREARETVERVSRITPRDETAQQEPSINKLDQWRADVRRQEAAFNASRAARQAAEDVERDDGAAWRDWVGCEISNAVRGIGAGLGEILSEKLNEIGAALDQRDKRIDKLEHELSRQAVTVARLEVRLCQALVDGDRTKVLDLPAWPQRAKAN
jgi:hypothetical protein